jgi:hypothetical protein
MKISGFPHHLFWSYSSQADLPEELIAEQVILYGDLGDLFHLSDVLSHEIIAAANEKIIAKGRWKKRSHFVTKVILER